MSQNKVPNLNKAFRDHFNDWYTNINLPPGNYQISSGINFANIDDADESISKSAQDYYDQFYGTWDSTYTTNKECSHEFVKYQGFTDSFEYCKHCDKKKDEIHGSRD